MMSNENVKQDEVTEISLSEIFSSIKHHLIMIFLIVVLCTGAGVLYLKFAVPQYEASATIMVKPLESSSSITSLLDMTSSSSSKISTEVELLTSRQSFQKLSIAWIFLNMLMMKACVIQILSFPSHHNL